jgi:hypothetical protein
MSEWGVLVPVAAITVGPIVWAFNNWTRAKHGQVMERFDGEFEKRDKEEARRLALLTNENEALHGKVGRLEERMAVLERIATDPAERTAREIEALR